MIYVLLPAYNEGKDVASLLDEFTRSPVAGRCRFVIVNDGSTDSTLASVREYETKLKLSILSHSNNMGLGKALSTGISHIAAEIIPGDVLVTMDADNTHKPWVIPDLIKQIEAGSDVAIASRFIKGSSEQGVPLARRVISHLAGSLLKIVFPAEGVRDYTSGFRAFSGVTVKLLAERFGAELITEDGFSATLEILLKARAAGARFAEVPFVLRYDDKSGKSKIKLGRTIFRYGALAVKMKFCL